MTFIVLENHFVGITFHRLPDLLIFTVHDVSRSETEGWRKFGDWTLDGYVKWDGCINWQTNPKCMAHGCGPETVDEIRDIFATVFHVAKQYFSILGDDVPDLPEHAIYV